MQYWYIDIIKWMLFIGSWWVEKPYSITVVHIYIYITIHLSLILEKRMSEFSLQILIRQSHLHMNGYDQNWMSMFMRICRCDLATLLLVPSPRDRNNKSPQNMQPQYTMYRILRWSYSFSVASRHLFLTIKHTVRELIN